MAPPADRDSGKETLTPDATSSGVLPLLDKDALRKRFAYKPRRRAFMVAMIFSLFFHLSMVTVFSIVIYFPREDIEFYNFRIIQTVPIKATSSINFSENQLRVPSIEANLEKHLGLEGEDVLEDLVATLPSINLPTLEFSELDRFRMYQDTLSARSRYDELFTQQPQDSWSRLATGLRKVGGSLLHLGGLGTEESLTEEKVDSALPLYHTPMEGFEAFIEWQEDPKERRLLYAPPIRALWDAQETLLEQSIEIVLQVNASGRVVNVWSPKTDQTGLLDNVQKTVLRYRFEPQPELGKQRQSATLHIRLAEATP